MELAGIDQCTGCGACASVCAKGCIKMEKDHNGFFYPKVNIEHCVDCGLCTKSCHIIFSPGIQNFEKEYFCGWDKSINKRFEGSSGGVFGAIAEYIIAKDGVVYEAAFSSDYKTLAHKSTDYVSIEDLKKSKYLESYMGNTISQIRKDLKDGKHVLFCGTPCQAYGVRKAFGCKFNNLIICDFLCHGVPSQARYQLYLKELEDRYNAPVKKVGFRTKRYGWKTYCVVIEFENGHEYVKLANEDPYYRHFFSNTNIRPSCYNCDRVANSVADITLGDFWGARKLGIRDDDKGTSLVICNTKLGKEIVDKISCLSLFKIKASDVAYVYESHNYAKRSTPRQQPFFENFKLSMKDKIVCALLKNSFTRTLIYRII